MTPATTLQPHRQRPAPWCALLAMALALAVSALAFGCGSDDGHPHDTTTDTHGHTGGSDVPLMGTAEQLGLSLTLRHEGGAPAEGENAAQLRIEREGAGVAGVEVTVEPWMPGHGHGTPVVPEVEDLGEGDYRITNLLYTMPGAWELRIALALDGEEDEATLSFEVAGEATGMHPEGEMIEASSGALGLVLRLRHMAAVPSAGDHAARVRVTREDAPVEGLELTVEPWMPGHGHGTPVVPEVEALGDGRYQVENIRYTMPGSWELRVTVREGADEDTVVFPVTVR